MSIYNVSPVGGGTGFKVQMVDGAGRIRVVGIFATRTDADLWIAADGQMAEPPDTGADRTNPTGR